MAATQPVRLPAGQLVLAGGGFMPARLLLVPVGARLPPGVHAVVAVPATAVVAPGSSGSRAIHLLPRAAVPAPVGAPLPPGVHAVATVPATAVVAPGGSGRRAIHLLPLAAVAAPGPGEPGADDWEWEVCSSRRSVRASIGVCFSIGVRLGCGFGCDASSSGTGTVHASLHRCCVLLVLTDRLFSDSF